MDVNREPKNGLVMTITLYIQADIGFIKYYFGLEQMVFDEILVALKSVLDVLFSWTCRISISNEL